MKKIIFASLLTVIFLAGSAMAANLSFTSTVISVVEGQNFVLRTNIDPQGAANYTVKLEVKYPAEILEVKSFSFGSGWMAVSQPGYDSTDNTTGVLVKTGGYPGGLNSLANFGTISFSAKKSGSGTIQITNNSFALDANSQNALSGTSQASVTITKTKASAAPVPSEEKTITSQATTGENVQPTTTVIAEQLPTIKETTLLAAMADLLTSQGGRVWLFLLGLAAGLAILLIFIKKTQSKKP